MLSNYHALKFRATLTVSTCLSAPGSATGCVCCKGTSMASKASPAWSKMTRRRVLRCVVQPADLRGIIRRNGGGCSSEGGKNDVQQPRPTNEDRRLPASTPQAGWRSVPVRRSRRLQPRTVAATPGHWRAEVDRHVQRAKCVLCGGRLCAAERPGRATGDERRRRAQCDQRCRRLLQRARPGHLHCRIDTAQVRRTWPGDAPHDGRREL